MEQKASRSRPWWILGSVIAACIAYLSSAGLLTFCFSKGWISEGIYYALCDTIYVPFAIYHRAEGPGRELIHAFLEWCYEAGK